MKKIISISFLASVLFLFVSNVYAGEWVADGTFYKYNEDGAIVVNDWRYIDGNHYHFDENGYMATGLTKIDNAYYYFYDDGRAYEMGKTVSLLDKSFTIVAKGKIANLTEERYNEYMEEINEKNAEKELLRQEQEAEKAMLAEKAAELKKNASTNNKQVDNTNSRINPIGEEAFAVKETQYTPVSTTEKKYQITAENSEKLRKALSYGNNSKSCAAKLLPAIKEQLTRLMLDIAGKYKEDLSNNPMIDATSYTHEFEQIIKAYVDRIDDMYFEVKNKYNASEEKMDMYWQELFDTAYSYEGQLDDLLGKTEIKK